MAGSETIVEGLPGFRVGTLRAASSTPQNSLEAGFQIDTLQNGAVAFVWDQVQEYRWFANSLATPSDPTVVIPLGQNPIIPGRWIQISSLLPDTSCVDFVINELSDLPTPVAGVITLVSGTYCFAPDVDLFNNRMVAPSGTNIHFQHGGVIGAIDDAAFLEIQDGAVFEAFQWSISNNTGAATGQAVHCDAADGVFVFFTRCEFICTATDGRAILHTGGLLSLLACRLTTATTLLELAATALNGTYLTQCYMSGATNIARVTGTHEGLFVNGGLWNGYSVGLSVEADIEDINFVGLDTEGFGDWIIWTAGAVRTVEIVNLRANAFGNGITWPAANIPSRMLSVLNSHFEQTPFVGFTATDARVFVRSSSGTAGPLSETPLVP